MPLDRANCVYKICCNDCDYSYIGQTSRQLQTQITEHRRKTKNPPRNPNQLHQLERDSAIALHALAESHSVDFENPKVLQYGFKSHKERMVAETLEISQHPSCVNRSDGKDISSVWLAVTKVITKR